MKDDELIKTAKDAIIENGYLNEVVAKQLIDKLVEKDQVMKRLKEITESFDEKPITRLALIDEVLEGVTNGR